MGTYIEFGTGCSDNKNPYEAGKTAAGTAVKSIKKFQGNLVTVFSSSKYDLAQVIAGVREITKEVPLIGATTAGEICDGFYQGSVVVSIIASDYMSVHVGVGRNVSADYRKAVHDAVTMTGKIELFDCFVPEAELTDMDFNYAKKCFGLILMLGATKESESYNYDVVDYLRRLSQNIIPFIGGCAGDDLRWGQTYLMYNGEVLTDCVIVALIETHLRFGVASSMNLIPTEWQASITKVEGHEIKEFYYEPAAEFYAKLVNVEIDIIKKDPGKYFTKYPLGVCDEFGSYSIIMGLDITPDNGIKCLRKPFANATVTIMTQNKDREGVAVMELAAKARQKGRIGKPFACMLFPSVFRMNLTDREKINEIIKYNNPWNAAFSGFVTYGEIGVNSDGISTYMDYAISLLIFADELNSASAVVFRNKILYEELSAVHQMANLLNSSLDQQYIMKKTAEMVGNFFQADGCILFLFNEQTDSFIVNELFTKKKLPKDLDIKKTLHYHAMIIGEPLIVNDVFQNKHVSLELNKITKAQSIIAAPIIVNNEKIGSISVYSQKKDFFNKDNLAFLNIIVNQIGTALVNAQLFEQTQLLACTDGLTGLYDHNFFLNALDRLIGEAERKNQPLSLVMVDLDDFKYINDKFGHTVGDLILKDTAGILKDSVRLDDIIARYGGDEFIIILVNAGQERAFQIAERMRRKISQMSFNEPDGTVSFGITASIGIATYPDNAFSAKNLIDRADKAMYRVKRQIKNKSQSYFSDFAELEKDFTAYEKAFFDTIKILVQILDSKDRYTYEHCRQVALYATQLAKALGLSEEEIHGMWLTGYLHDIGKIHIGSDIINKKSTLTEEEYSIIKLHPVVGANLLSPITGFKKIIPIVYHHHEWFDGSGYPDGIKGLDIPIGARLLTVVDGFDAMISNRPYRKAQTVDWALEELENKKGSQYDPKIADVFIKLIKNELAQTPQPRRRSSDKRA
jgi:diguanylate cyclase (GGDEF)-like protein/putative nucleotidyltransferase with HDIG domain